MKAKLGNKLGNTLSTYKTYNQINICLETFSQEHLLLYYISNISRYFQQKVLILIFSFRNIETNFKKHKSFNKKIFQEDNLSYNLVSRGFFLTDTKKSKSFQSKIFITLQFQEFFCFKQSFFSTKFFGTKF